jgi:hypothetical protein
MRGTAAIILKIPKEKQVSQEIFLMVGRHFWKKNNMG